VYKTTFSVHVCNWWYHYFIYLINARITQSLSKASKVWTGFNTHYRDH
jgi:hypothetical protein